MRTIFFLVVKSQLATFEIDASRQVYHRTHVPREEESLSHEPHFLSALTQMPLKTRTGLINRTVHHASQFDSF